MRHPRCAKNFAPDQMKLESLSRRERQIMDVLYARGRATAAEVMAALPDAAGYSAVRTLLGVLEEKGLIRRAGLEGRAVVYRPAVSRVVAQRSAVRRLLDTFFSGSVEEGVAALLSARSRPPTDEELERLMALVKEARRTRGR
jgi:BlaI family penicillinase repressor